MKRVAVSIAVVACMVLSSPMPAAASTIWRLQTVPKPPGTSTSLNAVSCPVEGDCTTVGQSARVEGNASMLAEHWDGSGWGIQAIPRTAGIVNAFLWGVSCASASSCIAVGWDSPPSTGGDHPVAEQWEGDSWAFRPVPSPAGAEQAALDGVSCVSPASCTAVGWYRQTEMSSDLPLAEHWNGTGWTVEHVPLPARVAPLGGLLNGVSCLTALDCTAVGYYSVFEQEDQLLAEHWNGTSWTRQSVPRPAGEALFLVSVSCSQHERCTAVGGSLTSSSEQQASIVARINRNRWSLQKDDAPAHTLLSGVSCPSQQSCSAVGEVWAGRPGTYSRAVAEHWNGTSWTVQALPVPRGAAGAQLDGVGCFKPSYCTAVGVVAYGGPRGTPMADHEG